MTSQIKNNDLCITNYYVTSSIGPIMFGLIENLWHCCSHINIHTQIQNTRTKSYTLDAYYVTYTVRLYGEVSYMGVHRLVAFTE